MFSGYYRNQDMTDDVLDGKIYHTRDIAWRDEWGYYWYVGRADDVIKSSGYRIGPFEVESALLEHPAVLETAITGVPDPLRGQVVKATIVLKPGYEPSDALKKELQDHVKHLTAPYKYPAGGGVCGLPAQDHFRQDPPHGAACPGRGEINRHIFPKEAKIMDFTPVTFHLKDGRTAVLSAPTAEDAAEMVAFLKDVAAETEFLIAYPEERQAMTEAQEVAFLQHKHEDPNALMLMCRVEGRLTGTCDVSFGSKIKVAHRGTIGISVRREFWGLGIGTAMFRELIAVARRRPGTLQLELDFMEGNQRGRALYEKMGFRVVGVKPDAIRLKSGELRNEYAMMLKL